MIEGWASARQDVVQGLRAHHSKEEEVRPEYYLYFQEAHVKRLAMLTAMVLVLPLCGIRCQATQETSTDYLDYSERDDLLSGGVKMIPVTTPKGTFRVWTKRIGNNPTMKVLLLHGGPGFSHKYLEASDSYLPAAGIEYYSRIPSCGICRGLSKRWSRFAKRWG
jgi:hypothetical protein